MQTVKTVVKAMYPLSEEMSEMSGQQLLFRVPLGRSSTDDDEGSPTVRCPITGVSLGSSKHLDPVHGCAMHQGEHSGVIMCCLSHGKAECKGLLLSFPFNHSMPATSSPPPEYDLAVALSKAAKGRL